MPHPSLEGFSPTIKAHYLNDYELDEDTMNDAKEYFEAGEPDEFFRALLISKEFDRQKLLDYYEFAEKLSEGEEEKETFKDIVRCLGHFPKYEKIFLANFLSCTSASQDDKFEAVEEAIFSKTDEFLLRFVEAESSLNSKIIESVSTIGNPNITNAVKAAFEIKQGSTIDPFPLSEEMYTIKEDGRSMKTSYKLCRSIQLRKVFLKNLLAEADRCGNTILVAKIVLSHCYIDLESIMGEIPYTDLSDEDKDTISELQFFNPPILSNMKELSCLRKIKGQSLRQLIEKAFDGSW